VAVRIQVAARESCASDLLPLFEVDHPAVVILLGDIQKDRFTVGAEALGRKWPIVVDLVNGTTIAVTNGFETYAEVAEGFHEPEFDEVPEAQFDLIALVLGFQSGSERWARENSHEATARPFGARRAVPVESGPIEVQQAKALDGTVSASAGGIGLCWGVLQHAASIPSDSGNGKLQVPLIGPGEEAAGG
jgi:hypothetical protein